MESGYKPRWLADKLRRSIEFSPVIVLSGARQTGKSTLLANEPPFRDWHYISFDDLDSLSLALKRPEEILNISKNIIIDEVQRAPELLHAVKIAVDKDRSRRIILSGSARLMLMNRVSESLSGRAIYYDLMPFSYGELLEIKYNNWLDLFMKTGELPSLNIKDYIGDKAFVDDLYHSLFRGFLPPVAFLNKEEQIASWWKGYVKTYLERDLRSIAEIAYLPDFRKMMELIALRNANILKQSEIARDAGLSQSTAGRYISILEETSLISKVRPYAKNISKRLIKSPKIIVTDSGLASSLAGFLSTESVPKQFMGAIFESYVFLNLSVRASLMDGEIMYLRTQGGLEKEVDFILERGNQIIGIEVKLSDTVSMKDIKNLLLLKDFSDRFACGLIVYSGSEIKKLAQRIYAVPWFVI